MGCAGDWHPAARPRSSRSAPTASTPARSTSPAGSYEYKVATQRQLGRELRRERRAERRQHRATRTDGRSRSRSTATRDTKVSRRRRGPRRHAARQLPVASSAAPATGSPTASRRSCRTATSDGVLQFTTDDLPDGLVRGEGRPRPQLGRELRRRRRARRREHHVHARPTGKLVDVPLHARDARARDRWRPTRRSRAPASRARTGSSEDTLAWPADLGAASAADATWHARTHSADAALAVADGDVTGGDEPIDARPRSPAGLTDAQIAKFPALEGYLALHPVGLDRGDGAAARCTEQLAVAAARRTAR